MFLGRTREACLLGVGLPYLEPLELHGSHRAHSLAPHALGDLLARVALLQPQQPDVAHTAGREMRWFVRWHMQVNTKTPTDTMDRSRPTRTRQTSCLVHATLEIATVSYYTKLPQWSTIVDTSCRKRPYCRISDSGFRIPEGRGPKKQCARQSSYLCAVPRAAT